jgi:predicted RNA-binding protein Jag
MTYKKPNLKSVIEESSSVIKAIEKAWAQVGKPAEFSVKVFESEQKNFLGMSVKSAKIGIFFQDQTTEASSKDTHRAERPQRHERNSNRPAFGEQGNKPEREQRPERAERERGGERNPRHRQGPREGGREGFQPERERREPQSNTPRWSERMLSDVRVWLETTLKLVGSQITFTTQVHNYCLKIVFSQHIFADNEKERAFYRLASYLMMQSLRTSSKDSFRGFKIIMTTAQQ